MTYHVIDIQSARWRDIAVVVSDNLSGGEHEIVADRRMGVGVILRGEPVLRRQTVEVGHGRTADHARIVGILFHHNKDVPSLRHLSLAGAYESTQESNPENKLAHCLTSK